MAMSISTSGVASAVNALNHYCPEDQEALLQVITDYFDPESSNHESDSDEESDGSDEIFSDDASLAANNCMDVDGYKDDTNAVESHHDEANGEEQSSMEESCEIRNDEDDGLENSEILNEIVREVSSGHSEVEIEPSLSDKNEIQEVEEFVVKGCGCKLVKGGPCSQQFSSQHILDIRSNCLTLSHDELDMAILGQIMANSNFSSSLITDRNRHQDKHRTNPYSSYWHNGKRICKPMFQFFHTIGKNRLNNLISSFRQHGLTPRIHGNTKRVPHNVLSLSSVEHFVKFLLNYADQHAILLPGRIPGYHKTDIKLLPSSVSKRSIWHLYSDAALSATHVHKIAYSTFTRLWRSLLPSIILMKPMSDLCWTCQQNSTAIVRAANKPESEKSSTIEKAQDHLLHVQLERSYYKTTCDSCRQQILDHFRLSDGTFSPPSPHCNIFENSVDITAHYSFDYAQQVHYPSNPLQPGPIFFLTPRKCNIFGVHCEGIPRQVNFLTDEAADCGKGANVVISQLHYFFLHHGLGEKTVFLHCDNCTGQNKNNLMIQYLLWRCLTRRHTQITLSFLVVGHTKFAPDWCFGLLKRLYRRTKVSSLCEIAEVVNNSAVCNVSQLVADEHGTTLVPIMNWSDFFASHFKKLSGIKKYHHFQFDTTDPGIVKVKERSDNEPTSLSLIKDNWSPEAEELPSIISAKPLSSEHQWYLYDSIRPFCSEESKDITCPFPSVPRVGSRSGTPVPVPVSTVAVPTPISVPELTAISPSHISSTEAPASKRQRLCGKCKKPGHNSRSCHQL